ncbi:hypothetical protein ACHQM5_027398 [Ranunculus cassubicifolius]
MAYELIPIGTFLALLTNQVIKTAQAANDVLVEKESFKVLSKHLSDIEPILKELQFRKLDDSLAARIALESLEKDVKKANELMEKYKNPSRFYILLRCRHIVKEVQDVTRDIGKSLANLSLATTEVLTDISEQVNRLHYEMQRVELGPSQANLRIVQKLDQALKDQISNQGFANAMLEDILRAVGVPVEPIEINRELASFRQEIKEAAARKNRAEEYFLQQVIELLSRADAAKDQVEIKKHYFLKLKSIERISQENIPPLQSFICPIKCRDVMVDPVSLCTGTTCEREAIESWFRIGERVDPKTGEPLDDFSLRPNHLLRRTIEEWKELNYCLKIRSVKKKLQSREDETVKEGLIQMQEIVIENPITKDWVSIEGLIDICLSILGSSHNKDIKKSVLMVLKATVEGNTTNKEKIVESQGMSHIVTCLGRSENISTPAVELLFDLLQDRNGWNLCASRKLTEQRSAILFLVMLMNKKLEKAERILLKLCNDDDKNVIEAAKANWYKPLIDRLVQGPESSRMSMVKALVQMEMVDQSLKSLGEVGVIPPLLGMVSGNTQSKDLALSALIKLSLCRENKKLIAACGGVPLILDNLISPVFIVVKCCMVLERLSSNDDGLKFFVHSDGSLLDTDKIITNLLGFLQNPNLSYTIRKPALRTLHGICKSEEGNVVKAIVRANGVDVVLQLLDDSDEEIREVSLHLLFHFSQHEPEGIVEFLLLQRRWDRLVAFLEDDSKRDAQMAAVGLLANLPNSKTELTKKLTESNGISTMLKILKSGTMEAKENALSVLFRFTDPTDIELQKMVVEMGVYPLLVNFLKSGSTTAKARAAALIGNLSLSSPKLTGKPKPTNFWHFGKKSLPTCDAHGVICSIPTTFCILEANALPELVKILHEKIPAIVYEVLPALSTLICEDRYYGGVKVLHEANAISPILDILNWGEPKLKEEALGILEKVFRFSEMVVIYGESTRVHLVGLATRNIHEDDRLKMKATRVLLLLQGYSRSSMPLA